MLKNPIEASFDPTKSTLFADIDGKKIYNTCYTSVKKHHIKHIEGDDNFLDERTRAIRGWSKDGINPMTKEEQDFEREVNKRVIKQFTMKIFTMDLAHFSFPVEYSEPRSFLERMADLFSFLATTYLDKAANVTESVKRLEYITVGVIASFHLFLQSKKPWNPVIGETFVCRWPNGAVLYSEQTSHHPPISNFEVFSGDGKWECYAQCNFKIKNGLRKVEVLQKGFFNIIFSDGDMYRFEFPDIHVMGFVMDDRIVRVAGTFVCQNIEKGLESVIEIAPKGNKSRGIEQQLYTFVWGGIKSIKDKQKDENYTTIISGDYAKQISVNGNVVWDINKDHAIRPCQEIEDDMLLLSDSRFRIDRAYLIDNKMDVASSFKVAIEEAQRNEEKLRKRKGK